MLREPSKTAFDEAIARSMFTEFPLGLRETPIQDSMHVEFPGGTTMYYKEEEPRCLLDLEDHGITRVARCAQHSLIMGRLAEQFVRC